MSLLVTDTNGPDGIARAHAFHLLLQAGRPVAVDELARSMHFDLDQLTTTLDELDRAGRIRRDATGRVIGSAGLSVVPDRHQMTIEDRIFWTWCAYDILGIMGALRASGRASSTSPVTGVRIELEFRHGAPQTSSAVLFRPDDTFAACCTNVYEEWCPNSNLFEDMTAASRWSSERGIGGRILALDDATAEASWEWRPLVDFDLSVLAE